MPYPNESEFWTGECVFNGPVDATAWPSDEATARAVEEVSRMSRDRLIARLDFLAAGATREALERAAVVLMTAPSRPLDAASLAEEQRYREAVAG